MVDHITEVNQWVMGMKCLLQQQQLAQKEKEFLTTVKMTESSMESANVTEYCTQSKDEDNEPNNIILDN